MPHLEKRISALENVNAGYARNPQELTDAELWRLIAPVWRWPDPATLTPAEVDAHMLTIAKGEP